MRKILGLDIGDKRIGIAISDDLGITAQSVGTIKRQQTTYAIKEIKKIVEEKEVTLLVIGMPYRTGEEGKKVTNQGKKIEKFAEKLKEKIEIPIKFQDERFTTKETERVLKKVKVKRKKINEIKDKISAQLILQTFLDKNELRD